MRSGSRDRVETPAVCALAILAFPAPQSPMSAPAPTPVAPASAEDERARAVRETAVLMECGSDAVVRAFLEKLDGLKERAAREQAGPAPPRWLVLAHDFQALEKTHEVWFVCACATWLVIAMVALCTRALRDEFLSDMCMPIQIEDVSYFYLVIFLSFAPGFFGELIRSYCAINEVRAYDSRRHAVLRKFEAAESATCTVCARHASWVRKS